MYKDADLWVSLRETKNIMNRFVDRQVLQNGCGNVTAVQIGIIHYLCQHIGDPIYQKDLEDFFHIRRSTITGILQNLEKNGYIKRISVLEDKRLKQIIITRMGMMLDKKMNAIADQNETIFFDGFSEQDKEQLFGLLERIRNNILREEERYD